MGYNFDNGDNTAQGQAGYYKSHDFDATEEERGLTNPEENAPTSDSEGSDEIYEDLADIIRDPVRLRKEKINVWKNLLLICFSFMCNFTAFAGVSNLQSSLNYEDGLGVGSLSIIYASLIVSAMFLPTYVISYLGCKCTICVSILGYTTYSLANFHAVWGTLVPASIIVGFSAAPLWSAKCAYLTTLAKKYAKLTGETTDTVVNRFFGIFFLFFQFNNIIGNLISSFVLSSEESTNLQFPTCYSEEYIDTYCGKNDCQEDFNVARKNFTTDECPVSEIESGVVHDSLLYTLMGTYTGIALLGAAVTAIFVDKIKLRKTETRGPLSLLIASFMHMRDKRQLLLIPLTMYSGFEQAFITGDVTRSFVTCPLAVNWVGFVLICYGACDSVFSFLMGYVEKYTGRPPLFTIAALINLALIIVFQVWIPYPQAVTLFFLLPALWGVSDAVWQTQLNAFYGVLFINNQEAAFANYRLWESVGFVISFGYQGFLCVSVKMYILLAVLVVGMPLYFVVEIMERRKRTNGDVKAVQNEAYLESNQSGINKSKKTQF